MSVCNTLGMLNLEASCCARDDLPAQKKALQVVCLQPDVSCNHLQHVLRDEHAGFQVSNADLSIMLFSTTSSA